VRLELARRIRFESLEGQGELLPQRAHVESRELRIALEDALLFPEPTDGVGAAFHAPGELAQRLALELGNGVVERRVDLREHGIVELGGDLGRELERRRLRSCLSGLALMCKHGLPDVLVGFETALDGVAEQGFNELLRRFQAIARIDANSELAAGNLHVRERCASTVDPAVAPVAVFLELSA